MKRLGDFFSHRQEPGFPGLPVMSVTMNDSLVLRDEIDRRLESALRPEQHLLVKKGDIAYNMMRMWQGACGLATSDGIVSPAYVVLAPKPGVDNRFAYHWFKSDRMMYLFWAYSHGLTEDRLRLYFDEFAEIPASPPALSQQRRIASLLDTWDQALDETEQLLKAKRRRYRGLLNKLCHRAFTDDKANDWLPRKLGSVFIERDERRADLPLLSITGGKGVIPRESIDRRLSVSEDKSNYKIILPGDIGYNTMRMWQGVFGRSAHTGIVSPAYTIVTAIDGEIDPVFASHLFGHPRAISLFHRHSQGLVDDTLMLKFPQFSEITMRLPGIAKQLEIGRVLETEESGLRPQDEYLSALHLQKLSLMQKLLTGEWRPNEAFDAIALSSAPSFAGRVL